MPMLSPDHKPRIIVVEDEAIVARDIGQQLLALGYDPVGHATTGEQAACATLHSFEAVVAAVDNFREGQPFNDDVSLVEIHCVQGLLQGGGREILAEDKSNPLPLNVLLR